MFCEYNINTYIIEAKIKQFIWIYKLNKKIYNIEKVIIILNQK